MKTCENCVFWMKETHICLMIRQILKIYEDVITPRDFGCVKFRGIK